MMPKEPQLLKARLPRLPLLAAVSLLVGAAAMQVYALVFELPTPPAPHLATAIPDQLTGWSSHDYPLAETDEGRTAISSILRFDQHVSRLFTRNGTTLTIYAAYWAPNKVPPRAVGVHTPDTCWVQNGWKRTNRHRAVAMDQPANGRLQPAEFGTYTMQGVIQYVYFWHLVGGKPYAYDQDGLHSLIAPFQDMTWFGLNQRREQLFIRVASNVPFEQIQMDLGVRELFQAIAALQPRS